VKLKEGGSTKRGEKVGTGSDGEKRKRKEEASLLSLERKKKRGGKESKG